MKTTDKPGSWLKPAGHPGIVGVADILFSGVVAMTASMLSVSVFTAGLSSLTALGFGAVVLVDTTRLDQCFQAVDYFEARQIPFVVGVNCFDGIARHDLDAVRDALAVPEGTPLIYTDARSREATKQTLITLVQLAMQRLQR